MFDLLFPFQHINASQLAAMLFMPVCILAVSFIIGLLLNKLVRRRIANHLTIEEDTLQYVLIHALRGLPLAWCLGIGLYWMINSLDIAAPIKHLLSYILFTIIVFTITRVAARTLAGMIDIRTQRSAEYPRILRHLHCADPHRPGRRRYGRRPRPAGDPGEYLLGPPSHPVKAAAPGRLHPAELR